MSGATGGIGFAALFRRTAAIRVTDRNFDADRLTNAFRRQAGVGRNRGRERHQRHCKLNHDFILSILFVSADHEYEATLRPLKAPGNLIRVQNGEISIV